MAELLRTTIREQLGADDPAISAPGLVIRVLDPAGQFYVTHGSAPLAPNRVTGTDPYLAWLAPDRALLVAEAVPASEVGFTFVSDVTDGLAVFEISGAQAPEIISGGCTLNPNGPELAPGACAQTVFGGVRVLIYVRDGRFRLHVERQLAAFLLEWFRQAASALTRGHAGKELP